MKSYYLPQAMLSLLSWLFNFAGKLPTYATKYAITSGEVTDVTEIEAYYRYWVNYHTAQLAYSKKVTAYIHEIEHGTKTGVPSVPPVFPSLGVVPTAVASNALSRIMKLATRIKASTSYAEGDGKDLGIVGADEILDLINCHPVIELKLVQNGKVEITVGMAGFEAYDLFVDRGVGTFTFLVRSLHSKFIDTVLPAAGDIKNFRYEAIYIHNNIEVGKMGDIKVITVEGH